MSADVEIVREALSFAHAWYGQDPSFFRRESHVALLSGGAAALTRIAERNQRLEAVVEAAWRVDEARDWEQPACFKEFVTVLADLGAALRDLDQEDQEEPDWDAACEQYLQDHGLGGRSATPKVEQVADDLPALRDLDSGSQA